MNTMDNKWANKNKILNINNISVTLMSKGVRFKALKQISFDIYAGQHTAILGANGAGKSTLLEVMGGYVWIDSDNTQSEILWFDPEEPAKKENSPIYARSVTRLISPAQQEKYIQRAWRMSGLELILTGFENSPLMYTASNKVQNKDALDIANNLNIVNLLSKNIKELSQGQLRILLLAKALISQPQILFLDEYLDGLDLYFRTKILQYLKQISKNLTIILTTHRKKYLPSWLEQIIVLDMGKIIKISAHNNSDKHIITLNSSNSAYELTANNAPKDITDIASMDKYEDKVQTNLALSSQKSEYELKQQNNPNIIVEVNNASVFIERQHVLHNINWILQNGEHWQITGNNGSGKSTFLRLLAREEYAADGGDIVYFFQNENGCREQALETNYIKQKIHIVSDLAQALYYYNITVEEVVLSAFDASIGVYREFSADEYAQAHYWLSIVDMEIHAKSRLDQLSTGQARRVFLARALMDNPEVLLLDEPFSGLDDMARKNMNEILERICEKNIQTVLVSHYQEDQLKSCNRLAHMENGKLLIVQ